MATAGYTDSTMPIDSNQFSLVNQFFQLKC